MPSEVAYDLDNVGAASAKLAKGFAAADQFKRLTLGNY
jgi:hypothetical protein